MAPIVLYNDWDTNLLTCQLVNLSTKIKDDYATPYYIYIGVETR